MGTRHSGSDLVDLILDQWHRETPDLDVSSIAVLGRLHRADLRYQALVADELGRFGLSTAAFDVLMSLRRSGPTYRRTAGELAEVGLITSGGLTQRIDRLERDGLVERTKEPGDRRKVFIQLTDSGRKLIDEVLQAHFTEQNQMLAGLTQTEHRQLAKLLARLEVSLEVYDGHQLGRAEPAG
ncbi:MarR family winged helix-turn-helix transcriptional regulator [Leekyejoonella antrihumi]|uniref:MarR family transcriptional regulator n=1 Tax=Leekyejoonella antrihumi TaxID=1660198 RepID=A0A563DWL0_9MICO|nr:MarR family transcriptional regulator [Leekyejoonella antrihumi]TWP34678.1 MarR family transcriptional regulator [Leekyejoonella antrihumi]